MTSKVYRQYDIIAMDNQPNQGESANQSVEGAEVAQGQEIYSTDQNQPPESPLQVPEEISQGEESQPVQYAEQYTQYATPPSMPPLTPTEQIMAIGKRFAIPLILIIIAIGLIAVFFRLIQGGFGGKKEVTLTYWVLWEDERSYQALIAEYQKIHPNVKIVVSKQTPKEYRERLENALLKGEGPDIFRFHNTWLPMFLQKGVIAAVPEKISQEIQFESSFYPVVKSDLRVENAYYGVPLMFDALGLYYNESLLKAAGIAVPKTWAEVDKAIVDLTVPGRDGKIETSGIALGTTNNVEFWSDILGLMLYLNGANPHNPEGDSARDVLLFYTKYVLPPDNVWDSSLDNSILAFASGKLAMMFAPSWIALEVKAINPQLTFKIAPVPQFPGVAPVAWATYWVEGVSAKSASKDEAFAFLSFLVKRENLSKLYTEQAKVRDFGSPYSRVDLAEQLKGHPLLDAIVTQGPYAKSGFLSSRTLDNGLNDHIIKYYEDAVNAVAKGNNPTTAIQTVNQGVRQVLSQYGVTSGR